MPRTSGLRDQKKLRTRRLLADVAASLFAEHGYDAVAITDVARVAEVSDQTVYNYFPTKPDLVLDRADEIRELYGRVVAERTPSSSPADALRPLVHEDIDRYLHSDPRLARGEFPALCLQSPTLRRFALEAREHQARTISEAILGTGPHLASLSVHAHAAALVAVVQQITDRIGAGVLEGADPARLVSGMRADTEVAFDDLSQHFHTWISSASAGTGEPR